MKNKEQYHRELKDRDKLDSKYVVNVIRNHQVETNNGLLSTFLNPYLSESSGEKPLDYSQVLVMPFGDRNLDTSFRSERPNTNAVRVYMRQVGEAVQHLHDSGRIHGDLKMQNVVRINDRLSLIDLDASAKIEEDYIGSKFSSGILPPEMALSIDGSRTREKYEKYFGKLLSKKLEPIYDPDKTKGFVVKTFVTKEERKPGLVDVEGLPYDLIRASSAIDVWSFGTILYSTYTGRPLFEVNRDDDIDNSDVMESLFNWNDKRMEEKLSHVNDSSLARNLLRRLLRAELSDRPTMLEALKDPFFHPDSILSDRVDRMVVFQSGPLAFTMNDRSLDLTLPRGTRAGHAL